MPVMPQLDRTHNTEGQRGPIQRKEAGWLDEERKRSISAEGRSEGAGDIAAERNSKTPAILQSILNQLDSPIPSPAEPPTFLLQRQLDEETHMKAVREPAPPSISLMIDIGEQVPAQMQIRWTDFEQRVQQQQKISPPPSYRFHQYVLRVGGVRSERHFALLSAGPLSVESIPPLHIYPHGIRQHRVCIRDCGVVELSHEQLTLAERFHLHAFSMLKEREELAPHVPPFPRPPEPGCWSSACSAASSKQYLLLPCHPKSSVEQSLADLEGWLRVDEHDAHHMSEAEVQQELEWQKELRDSLSEGMAISLCGRAAAASDDYIESEDVASEGTTFPLLKAIFAKLPLQDLIQILAVNRSWSAAARTMAPIHAWIGRNACTLDFVFMRSVLDSDPAFPASSAASLSRDLLANPPRTLLLYTPYSGRFYSNLSLSVPETALSPFPKRDYANYKEYYQQRWAIPVLHPESKLIAAANFSTAPINVLQPLMLSLKKRQAKEPVMLLLPDATQALETMPAQMLHLLRMMPCILHRLEVNLLHSELAMELGLKVGNFPSEAHLRPYVLRQSMTSGNAQEAFPLPTTISEPWPASTSTTARSGLPRGFAASLPAASTIAPPSAPPAPPVPLMFSYDRLKFIGDSVLKLVMTKLLLGDYAHEAEEGITRRKGSMLNMRAMAKHALDKRLQRYVCAHPFHVASFKPPGIKAGSKGASRKASMGGEEAAATTTTEGADPACNHGEGEDAPSSTAASGDFSLFSASPTSSFPGPSSLSAGSSGSFFAPIHSQVSQHVLADLLASLVGAAWQSSAESGALQMMVALGLLHAKMVLNFSLRLKRFSAMAEATIDAFAGQTRLQTILASQNECERVIGYEFRSRALYVQAFSHERWSGGSALSGGVSSSSIVDSSVSVSGASHRLSSYERLELLGDAVLELCVSTFLTANFARASSSGDLTFLRQRLVSNQVLATHMRASALQPFVEPLPMPHFSSTATPAPKLMADVLEALLGAVYVDSDYKLAPVWSAFLRIVPIRHIDTSRNKIRTQCN